MNSEKATRLKILLLDGKERSSLAIMQSLSNNIDVDIICGENSDNCLCFYSKYCKNKIIYPDIENYPIKFVEWLKNYLKNNEIDVVIPTSDFSTTILSKIKKDLEFEFDCIILCSEWNDYIKTYDKKITFNYAEKAGIPYPKTYYIDNMDSIKTLKDAIYPLIIKPRMKSMLNEEKMEFQIFKISENNVCHNYEELCSKFKIMIKMNPWIDRQGLYPLLQEFISTKNSFGSGFEFIATKGTVDIHFMHKRLHEYPISGGASTLRESYDNDKLKKYSEIILKEMNYDGIGMVEFKDYNGVPYLMEINGRFWGSLPLALSCGVDFPNAYFLKNTSFQKYSKLLVDSSFNYKVGQKQKWCIGELLWLIESIAKKDPKEKLSSILDYTYNFLVTKDDILSLRDPMINYGIFKTLVGYGRDVLFGNKNLYGESQRHLK